MLDKVFTVFLNVVLTNNMNMRTVKTKRHAQKAAYDSVDINLIAQ